MNDVNSEISSFRWRDVTWGSKDWANQELRYAVYILKGFGVDSSPSGRISIALVVRDLLEEYDWPWQAERLGNWIHWFQRHFKDLEARSLGGSAPRGVSSTDLKVRAP